MAKKRATKGTKKPTTKKTGAADAAAEPLAPVASAPVGDSSATPVNPQTAPDTPPPILVDEKIEVPAVHTAVMSDDADKHVIPVSEIISFLHAQGYFGQLDLPAALAIEGERLDRAIKEYQAFHGLDMDGEVGPHTASTMARRRCGLPDYGMVANDSVCMWPQKRITYATASNYQMPGISPTQANQAFDVACAQWAAICGIEMVRVTSPNEANIYASSGTGRRNQLDNRGGTLAWSELPCNAAENSQMRQMYDEAEAWSFNMAVAVICHEVGHALGLPHLPKGNLLAPYYDPNVTKPQKGDVQEMIARYGERTSAPPPVGGGSGSGGGITPTILDVSGNILINGQPFVLVPRT